MLEKFAKVLIHARIYTVKRFKLAVRNTGDRRTPCWAAWIIFLFFFSFSLSFFPTKFLESRPFPPFYSLFSFFAFFLFFFFYDRPCKFLISTSKSEVMISPYVYILSWKVREAWECSLSFSLSNELNADNFSFFFDSF